MLLSSSNRKYPLFPLLYFSVVVCLRCLLHHILSRIAYTCRENREFVFIIIMQFMMSANIRIRFALQIILVSLYSTPSHYHHCANLSEDIELIKCLSDLFCRVWVRLSIFSQWSIIQSIIQYVGLCVFSLPTPLVMIERLYIFCLSIIIKSEVWTITHCLGLGHETMVCAICLSIFLWQWNHPRTSNITPSQSRMLQRTSTHWGLATHIRTWTSVSYISLLVILVHHYLNQCYFMLRYFKITVFRFFGIQCDMTHYSKVSNRTITIIKYLNTTLCDIILKKINEWASYLLVYVYIYMHFDAWTPLYTVTNTQTQVHISNHTQQKYDKAGTSGTAFY